MSRLKLVPRITRSFLKRTDRVMSAVGFPGRLPVCAEFDRSYRGWNAVDGDRTLRLDYPLAPSDIVFDVGGYHGDWADEIHQRYGCQIHVFEPLPQYCEQIAGRFQNEPDIQVHRFGLAGQQQAIQLGVLDDATSQFKAASETVACELRSISEFMSERAIDRVALLKLNIEGGEYELLEHLLETGDIHRFDNIQVQFHWFVPGAHQRMERIQRQLQASHQTTYQYRFVWENWCTKAA